MISIHISYLFTFCFLTQAECLKLENDFDTKTKQLETNTPIFQMLQEHFAKRNKEYEATKKLIAETKNKKNSLDDQIKRLNKEMKDLQTPMVITYSSILPILRIC